RWHPCQRAARDTEPHRPAYAYGVFRGEPPAWMRAEVWHGCSGGCRGRPAPCTCTSAQSETRASRLRSTRCKSPRAAAVDSTTPGFFAIISSAMSVKAYFRNIYDNVTSIAIGMKITIKYCFQKTVTVQYPEQRLTFAPRYRGIHEFEADKCIDCDMCAKACPVDGIYIDKTAPRKIDKKTGKVDPKGGVLLRYAIDY